MLLYVYLCTDYFNHPFLLIAAIIIIILSFIRIIIEIIEIYFRHSQYFLELENWLQMCSFVSSIIFVSYGLQSGCQCPGSWQWQIGAFSLLVSWLSLIMFLKEFPLTGIYVEMFIHIIFTFMKLFLFAFLLVISFGLTFYMIFFQPVSQYVFSSRIGCSYYLPLYCNDYFYMYVHRVYVQPFHLLVVP